MKYIFALATVFLTSCAPPENGDIAGAYLMSHGAVRDRLQIFSDGRYELVSSSAGEGDLTAAGRWDLSDPWPYSSCRQITLSDFTSLVSDRGISYFRNRNIWFTYICDDIVFGMRIVLDEDLGLYYVLRED